jgi:hypothetical protein
MNALGAQWPYVGHGYGYGLAPGFGYGRGFGLGYGGCVGLSCRYDWGHSGSGEPYGSEDGAGGGWGG